MHSSEIRIGKECFSGTSNFESIEFSNVGQISLFSQSFKNSTDLQNISFSKSSEVGIENDCFGDTKLRFISFSEVNKIKLSPQTFMSCKTLESIAVQNTKELIIGKECFKDSHQLKSIAFITDSIFLGDRFINGCNSLEFFKLQTKFGEITIFRDTFQNTKLKGILLDAPKIKLCSECFKGIGTLESLEIIGNAIEIGNQCIHSCQRLSYFTLKTGDLNIFNDYFNPSSLTILKLEADSISIDQNRFSGFKSLRKLIIKSKSKITLSMGCFSKSVNLFSVNLIGKEIKIENNCFSECSSLTEFNINDAINVTLGKGIFMKCKHLWTIDIGVAQDLIAVEGCFVSSSVEEVVFQGNKIDIGEKCFNGCSTLKKFHIISAETVTLGIKAFEGCSNLEIVNVNTSSKLKILEKCFYKNQKLNSMELQSKDLITGEYAFYKCTSIQFLSIEDSDRIVFGKNSFQDCTGLLQININAKNEFQAYPNCFDGAKQLKTVQIASNKVMICKYCFYMSLLMNSISILNADDTILGENAFECCKSLETVNVNSNKFKASSFCFLNANKLKIVDIVGKEVLIAGHCFDYCSSLTQVNCQSANKIKLYETSFNGYPYNRFLIHKEDAKIEIIHFVLRKNKNDSLFSFHFG